jgi:hypothetical protein
VDRNDIFADSLSFDTDTIKTVQPLDDMTRYYFRVIVYNGQGNYSASNIVDTVTPEDMKGKLKLVLRRSMMTTMSICAGHGPLKVSIVTPFMPTQPGLSIRAIRLSRQFTTTPPGRSQVWQRAAHGVSGFMAVLNRQLLQRAM